MALTIYRSSDAGAPSLTGAAGSLIALLDACLRTGYGTKAGAGWTKPFTGTNIAAFRQGAGGNGRYLRVWNARTSADGSGHFSANVRGYEAMTAVSAGTGAFPTTGQSPGNGLAVSYLQDGMPPGFEWILRATPSWFDLTVQKSTIDDEYFAFGSFPSFKSGDTFNEYISAGRTIGEPNTMQTSDGSASLYITRSDTGTGASVQAYYLAAGPSYEPYVGSGDTRFAYPNRPDNAALLHPYVLMADVHVRGMVPGLWGLAGGTSKLGFGSTFDGQGTTAGKSFQVSRNVGYGSCLILEVSDTIDGF